VDATVGIETIVSGSVSDYTVTSSTSIHAGSRPAIIKNRYDSVISDIE
jgi:hypothetical protein